MAEKTIIALQGDPDTGKSETIGFLFDLVKQNGFNVVMDKKKKDSHDFFVIVFRSGVLIGISTYGDVAEKIKEHCNLFVNAGCAVIVCACHKHGKTVEAVTSFRKYQSVFIPKTVAKKPQQKRANKKDARLLLNKIRVLVK